VLDLSRPRLADKKLLPRRFRSSGAMRPAVRVGLPSSLVAELGEWYGQAAGGLLTRMLTTGLDDHGQAWNQRPLEQPPTWG
jgi:hypothetical protein